MKKWYYFQLCVLLCIAGCLASGCLFKSKPAATRSFILSSAIATSASAGAQPLPVEIGSVKMPSYLLKSSMAIRKGSNEMQYLETASWADRLDQLFRQTLTQDLQQNLAPNQIHQRLRVSIEVQQFDVDAHGHATLLAHWRLTAANDGRLLKSHDVHLTVRGPEPGGNPQAIASTMSELTAQFSRELARAISESQSQGS